MEARMRSGICEKNDFHRSRGNDARTDLATRVSSTNVGALSRH